MKKLPPYAKKPFLLTPDAQKTRKILESLNLNTICQEARCPNKCECYKKKRATFLILGSHCTRNCLFCNVNHVEPQSVDSMEPQNLFQAVKEMELKHVVVTSVTRDDLADQGSGQFRKVVELLGTLVPKPIIEILTPDFSGITEFIDNACEPSLDIFNHNLETVPSLYSKIRPQANYQRSLDVISHVSRKKKFITKSGIMVGLGETLEELESLFSEVAGTGCNILTIGQYLQPSKSHIPVEKYYTPEEFQQLSETAQNKGIELCYSGTFVRSSYQAEEVYELLNKRKKD